MARGARGTLRLVDLVVLDLPERPRLLDIGDRRLLEHPGLHDDAIEHAMQETRDSVVVLVYELAPASLSIHLVSALGENVLKADVGIGAGCPEVDLLRTRMGA